MPNQGLATPPPTGVSTGPALDNVRLRLGLFFYYPDHPFPLLLPVRPQHSQHLPFSARQATPPSLPAVGHLSVTGVMSRRYPTAELYEERERDFYRGGGNRSERNYEELDVELRRGGDPRRNVPDFFREDYNRPPSAGALVMRQRDEEFTRGPRHAQTFNDDTRSVRSSRPPPSSVREVERDDITIRRSDGPERRRPREVDAEETDITIRRRDQSRPRQAEFREVDREDISFHRVDGPPAGGRGRHVESERDDVRFRGRGRGGGDEEIDIRHSEYNRNGRNISAERETIRFQERDGNFEVRAKRREFSREGRDSSRERSSLTIRGRERSLPPPSRSRGELVAREREEFVVRRPRDISPPSNPREVIKDEIIIRRKEERMPSPSPSPSPPPPPPPPALEPEIRPPIIQEIITHHRHIDHGRSQYVDNVITYTDMLQES